jgi:hypothetical protein
MLAGLIDRRLQAKKKGRPPGAGFMNPVQAMENRAASRAREKLGQARKDAGNTRLRRGALDQVIAGALDELGEIYDGDAPELEKVSIQNIRNSVKRGTLAKPARRQGRA